jgi:hypothetical protein
VSATCVSSLARFADRARIVARDRPTDARLAGIVAGGMGTLEAGGDLVDLTVAELYTP